MNTSSLPELEGQTEARSYDPFSANFPDFAADSAEGISFGQLHRNRMKSDKDIFGSFQFGLRYYASYYSLHDESVDQSELEEMVFESGYGSDWSTTSDGSNVSVSSCTSDHVLDSARVSTYLSARDVHLHRSSSERDLRNMKRSKRFGTQKLKYKTKNKLNKSKSRKNRRRRVTKVSSSVCDNPGQSRLGFEKAIDTQELQRADESGGKQNKRSKRKRFKRFFRRKLLKQRSEDSCYDSQTAGFRQFLASILNGQSSDSQFAQAIYRDLLLSRSYLSASSSSYSSALSNLNSGSFTAADLQKPSAVKCINTGSLTHEDSQKVASFSRPIVEKLDIVLEAGTSMKKFNPALSDFDAQYHQFLQSSSDTPANEKSITTTENFEDFDLFEEQKRSNRTADTKKNVETLRETSWEDISASSFNVRAPPNYRKLKRKAPSHSSLYDVVCCDCWEVESKKPHIARFMQLPSLASRRPRSTRHVYSPVPDLLIINIMLPSYPPSGLLSKKRIDGPGHSIVVFAKLSEAAKASCNDAALLLWSKFVNTSNPKERERLKMITRVANVEDLKLDRITSALVRRYNGVPWLVRPEYEFHRGEGYFEIDIDFHLFPYFVLSQAGPLLNAYGPKTLLDCALIIQGEKDFELPERVLACVRLRHLDFNKAPRITLQGSSRSLYYNPNLIVKTQQQFVDRDGLCHTIQPLKRQQVEKAALAQFSSSRTSQSSRDSSGSLVSSIRSQNSDRSEKRVKFESHLSLRDNSTSKKADKKANAHTETGDTVKFTMGKKYSRLKRENANIVLREYDSGYKMVRSISLLVFVIYTIATLIVG